jgi:hypothetical protein
MTINVPEIIDEVQKMSTLLSHHLIAISEHKIIICLLASADHNNAVQVVAAKRPITMLTSSA